MRCFFAEVLFKLLIIFASVNSVYSYEIEDSQGNEIQITDKNAVNAVDDIEMQENEVLTDNQIEAVVDDVEKKDGVATDV